MDTINNIKEKFDLIKLLLISVISVGIILFEDFHTNRIYFFIAILFMFFIFQISKIKIKRINRIYFFFIELILIFVLEYYSRYAINYFIHSLYILLIFDISINLEGRKSIISGIIILILASYKYIYIIDIKRNIDSIAQYFLFLILNISIVIVLNLVKSINKSKEEQKKLFEKIHKLSSIEERNKISREIHDSLGHQMVNIIMQLELINFKKDLSNIPAVIKDARETHKILRNIVESKYSDSSENEDDLKKMILNFKNKSNISIITFIDETIYYPKSIYKIIRECLTNSAKYSNATEIEIKLSADSDFYYFSIIDNGKGCNKIIPNIGLKGIINRVELLDGEVTFSGNNGFIVNGFVRRVRND